MKNQLHLIALEAEANKMSHEDFICELVHRNIPQEIITRLETLWHYTKKVGKKVINIGRIVIYKIIEFIKQHPYMSAGIALGTACAVLVSSLISWIPWVGTILQSIALFFGISIGAIAGHRLDMQEQGKEVRTGLVASMENIISITKEFFSLLIEIIDELKKEEMNHG